MKRSWCWFIATVCLIMPARALAQPCFGIPTVERQVAFFAALGLPEGGKTYSGGLHFDLAGPASVGFSAAVSKADDDAVDDDIITIGVHGLYEFANPTVSVCPILALEFSTFDTSILGVEFDAKVLTIPIGLGIGKMLSAGAADITLYGIPHFLYTRASLKVSAGNESESDTETESELGITVGARVSNRLLFGGLSFSMSSSNDWNDPVLTFTAGVMVGRDR